MQNVVYLHGDMGETGRLGTETSTSPLLTRTVFSPWSSSSSLKEEVCFLLFFFEPGPGFLEATGDCFLLVADFFLLAFLLLALEPTSESLSLELSIAGGGLTSLSESSESLGADFCLAALALAAIAVGKIFDRLFDLLFCSSLTLCLAASSFLCLSTASAFCLAASALAFAASASAFCFAAASAF